MIEFIIYGTDSSGRVFPRNRGMTTFCLQEVADSYVKKFPTVVHICIDVALPTTKDARRWTEGRHG